jgi:hypothetical protein
MADITRPIEPFYITQGFGVNPQNYAQFGLKGHNGWDIRTKYDDSPLGKRNILASWLMEFYRQGNEGTKGYGKFFEVVVKMKRTWKLTYAHCDSIQTFKTKKEKQTMAVSDNTGNSTGSHLHLTVKRIKINTDGSHTVLNYSNGYFGAVNPQEFFDELRETKNEQNGVPPMPDGTQIEKIQKDQILRDVYMGLCGSYSDDEIIWRLGSQENILQVITSICEGDSRFYDKWIKPRILLSNPIEKTTTTTHTTTTTPPLPGEFVYPELVDPISAFWKKIRQRLGL